MQNYHNIQIVDANEYSASKYILRKVEVPGAPESERPWERGCSRVSNFYRQ